MNAWFTRLLAGAACTAGALALSAAAAQADDHDGLDLGVVKVSTHADHTSSSHHSSSGSSGSSGGSHHSGGSTVSLRTPVHVRADVNLAPRHTSVHVSTRTRTGTSGGGGSNGSSSSRSNLASVRIGTGSSHHAGGSNRSYLQVRAHANAVKAQQAKAQKAEKAEKAKAVQVAMAKAVKAAKVRAAAQAEAARQHALDVRAEATLLKGFLPASRVLADGRVLDLPVRACVLVNTDGCDTTSTGASTGSVGTVGSGTSSGLGTQRLLSSVVTATATDVPVVGDLNACALVDATGCTSTGTGTTGSTGSGSRDQIFALL